MHELATWPLHARNRSQRIVIRTVWSNQIYLVCRLVDPDQSAVLIRF